MATKKKANTVMVDQPSKTQAAIHRKGHMGRRTAHGLAKSALF